MALLDKNNNSNSDAATGGGASESGRRRGLSVRIKLEPEYQTENSSGDETMQKVPSMSDLLEENSLGELPALLHPLPSLPETLSRSPPLLITRPSPPDPRATTLDPQERNHIPFIRPTIVGGGCRRLLPKESFSENSIFLLIRLSSGAAEYRDLVGCRHASSR